MEGEMVEEDIGIGEMGEKKEFEQNENKVIGF